MSHDTLSYNPTAGTWITAYSQIWFVESKPVNSHQCGVEIKYKALKITIAKEQYLKENSENYRTISNTGHDETKLERI